MASSRDDERDHSVSNTPKNYEQLPPRGRRGESSGEVVGSHGGGGASNQQRSITLLSREVQQQQQYSQLQTPLQYPRPDYSSGEAYFLSQSAVNTIGYKPGGGFGIFGGISPLNASGLLGGATSGSLMTPSAHGGASYGASSATVGSDERKAAASMGLLRGGSLDSTPRRASISASTERMMQQQLQQHQSLPTYSPGMNFHQYMVQPSETKNAAQVAAAWRERGEDPYSIFRCGSSSLPDLSPAGSKIPPSQQAHAILNQFPFVFDGSSEWVCRHCSRLPHYYRGPNYGWNAGANNPPSNSFVDQHLRYCPALNQPWAFGLESVTAQGGQHGQIPLQQPREGEGKGGKEGITHEKEKEMKFSRKRKQYIPDPPTGKSPMSDMSPEAAASMFPIYSRFASHMPSGISPHSRSPKYPFHYMNKMQLPVKKRKPTSPKKLSPKGRQTSDETYEKALSLLRKRADETPRPSSSDDVGSTLVQEEDNTLLTDYFYYMMLQLVVCRFTEKDRKTRGGKRENVLVGYGGLQCCHCASTPSSRKFYWSNVDRLANSFAEIPAHILKCNKCPQDVNRALLALKGRHAAQMALLPRGSQKVFFRRMWRRLHGGDTDAAVETVNTSSAALVETALKSPEVTSITASPETRERVLLAVPQDKDWLSDMDCFIRKQVEVFSANEVDVNQAIADEKYLIQPSQVGLRCVHCAKVDAGARGDAVMYPQAISCIYESVKELQRFHFDYCPNLPQELKNAQSKFTTFSTSLSSVLRRYYVQAARALGLFDSEEEGGGILAGGTVIPLLVAGFSGSFVAGKRRSSSPMDSEGEGDEKEPAKRAKHTDGTTSQAV